MDDALAGRPPTSHERMAGQPWDASYRDGPAPWDTGEPQPAVVRLASEGRFVGAVLDAGCGTGDNALHIASLGLSVLGVDVAETAVAAARQKVHDGGSRPSSPRQTRLRSSVCNAYSTPCWTAGCSTPSTPTSVGDMWRACHR